MKRSIFFILLFFQLFVVSAQNVVFVLVDVSKSIRSRQLRESRDALSDILKGNPPRNFTIETQAASANFKMRANDMLQIMRFGNKETVMNNNAPGSPIVDPANDIDRVINSDYPQTPSDDWTYITLAKARVAEIAAGRGIQKYTLILVSDNISDNFNGTPNYSPQERDLVSNYNTTSNQVVEKPADFFRNINVPDYEIRIQEIDIQHYASSQQRSTPPDTTREININPPLGDHTLEACHEATGDFLHISWTCKNAPAGVKYAVNVLSADDGDFNTSKQTTNNGLDLELPDGKYKVSVRSASPEFAATQDSTYVQISTGSYGWIFLALSLLVAGGAAYWFLDKKRRDKMQQPGTRVTKPDLFSGNTGSAHHKDSGGYF